MATLEGLKAAERKAYRNWRNSITKDDPAGNPVLLRKWRSRTITRQAWQQFPPLRDDEI